MPEDLSILFALILPSSILVSAARFIFIHGIIISDVIHICQASFAELFISVLPGFRLAGIAILKQVPPEPSPFVDVTVIDPRCIFTIP